MTASVLQERATDVNTSASSLALAFSSNVTAGSAIHVGTATFGASGVTFTITDNNGGSYTSNLDAINDATNTSSMTHAYAANHAAGATTVTATPSSSNDIHLVIREIGGVGTAPLDGHNKVGPAASPQTVSATNANQPALWSAIGLQDTSHSTPTTTNGVAGITWANDGSGSDGKVSSKRVTTAASQSEIFTSSGDTILAVIAIFDEAAGGDVPTAQIVF